MSPDLPSPSPVGSESLRRQNTARLLGSLRRSGPATRAQLAKRTGLAKATVGVIVADLAASGAVDEDGSRTEGRGRPGRPVRLRERTFLGLGLEVNVDYVSAVVLDLAGRIQLSETRPVAPGTPLAGHPVLDLVRAVGERFPPAEHTLVGVTVAVPGLVRGDNRTVAWAPNLGLDGPLLADALEASLEGRVAVRVDNDANCAALAEAHHGAATDTGFALYLTGTVGIGAGLLNDGHLVHGASGFAGEVGHMPIGDPAALCGCGRLGCWEATIGLHAMLARTGMPELATPLRSAEHVAERAAGDPKLSALVAAVGRDVGMGLATLANVLDPAVIVLGGYFVPLGELILGPARRVLDERLASAAQDRPELRFSTLGIQAAATGAAEQSLRGVFAGEVAITDEARV
ncbi:ROK family protein [Nocardioides sp.]|uniref:ROK family protein n=1 Tax=Nocardioides sp. TaxID=35761 RepID=UPI003D0AA1A9